MVRRPKRDRVRDTDLGFISLWVHTEDLGTAETHEAGVLTELTFEIVPRSLDR